MELLPAIHLIDGVSSNVYLIDEPTGLTVIDTGMPKSAPAIMQFIRRMRRSPMDVRRIILTHQHFDHVGGAAALADETGAEVLAHRLDAPAIDGSSARELPSGFVGFLFRQVLIPRLQPARVAGYLADGQTLPILEQFGGLRVVETPGHTSGHLSLYVPGYKLLFAGDAYRHEKDTLRPSPRLFNTDTAQAQKSLRLLAENYELNASLPGHGTPILKNAGDHLKRLADTQV